jgi:transcription elongation GreA/GreB family factor
LSFVAEVSSLIEKKQFDELESIWMSRLESSDVSVDEYLEAARLLRKADERSRADALLELLADGLKSRGDWPGRLRALKEMARLTKKPGHLRANIEEALQKTYGSRPAYKKVMSHVKFNEPDSNPAEKAEKAESWLTFDEGEYFFMNGRGAGVVVDLNPELGVCRLDFEKEKRVSVPLGAAQKFLVPLPEGHILREKFTNFDALRERALKKASDLFEQVLKSFHRPMIMAEIRDAMIGIVPEEKWASWWTTARKNPRIVVHGTGAKATYAWAASTDAAEAAVRTKFAKAKLDEKIELAKKHSGRSQEIANEFSNALAQEAARIARSEPAKAFEILSTLEKLPGKYESTVDPVDLLSGPMAARVAAAIEDRQFREKALRIIHEHHPDAPKIFGEAFFFEEDPRVLSLIEQMLLEKGHTAMRERLIDETMRYPRRHPRAFYWYAKSISESNELPEKNAFNMLLQLVEALHSDEFAPLKARLKDFFDKGGLAVRIIMNAATEDQARKFVDTIDRHGVLEEYRRDLLKGAALMRYPTLRQPEAEPIYATAESLKEKREEFERIKTIEVPANLKAIQEAREMGDLRENFEYKAARQRQEYLAARLSALQGELSRVRVLSPEEIETSEVRVGAKVALSNGDVQRDVTILGPWESSPEHGVYSNQSDAAKALLGKKIGDIVSFMGNDYEIKSIAAWR